METARRLFWFLFVIAVTIATALFVYWNREPVMLKFAIWTSPTYPLFLFLILAFIAGVLVSGAVSLIEILRLQSKLRKSRRLLDLLEREVDALRNQPLYDEPPRPALVSGIEQRFTHEGQPEDSLDYSERKKIG